MRHLASSVLLAGIFLVPADAGSLHAADPALRTVYTSGGVELTLVVPPKAYAPNTLAPMHVRMKNVSRHPLQVVIACPPMNSPYVQVLDAAGSTVFPPAVPGAFKLHGCTGFKQTTLAPDQTIARRVFVLLRDARVRAVALARPIGASGPVYRMVMGPAIGVDLSKSEAPPTAIVSRDRDSVQITVQSPVPTHGPLRYQYWADCTDTTPQTFTWKSAPGNTVRLVNTYPSCPRVAGWHIAVGWLGHPVAFVDA